MMQKITSLLAVATLSLSVSLVSLPAMADSTLIAERKAKFSKSAQQMRQMRAQFQAGDYEAIQASADAIAMWAASMTDYFPANTSPEVATVKTSALPSIWQRFDEFSALAANHGTAARALSSAAADGNADEIMAKMQAMGKTCGACHSQFKQ